MKDEKVLEMARLRFSVINPLLCSDGRTLKERLEEQAAEVWTLPCGSLKQFKPASIEDWYYAYRSKGFDGLICSPRRDKGLQPSISREIEEKLLALLEKYPKMKSSGLLYLLDKEINERPSDSTMYRFLARTRIQFLKEKPRRERRAFEADYANQIWQVDFMGEVYIKVKDSDGRFRKKKVYLLAVIDDKTRVVCDAAFYFEQDLMAYLKLLERAMRKRGIPEKIYCDNGKVFLSAQVKRVAEQLGTRVLHARPRDAAAKGKIERWFKSVQDLFVNCIMTAEQPNSLGRLNELLFEYVEKYNNRKHSSLGMSPIQCWAANPRRIRLLGENHTGNDLFLLEENRKVRKDGTVSLKAILFEIDYAYVGQKVTIRYDLHDLSRIFVYFEGKSVGTAYPLDRTANNGRPRNNQQLEN